MYGSNNPVTNSDPLGLFDYDTRLKTSKQYNIDVAVLQNELKWKGYYSGEIDGLYGQQTLYAVNAYKNATGLGNEGDNWGVVGAQTWESLGLIFRTRDDKNAGVEIATFGLKQYKDFSEPVYNALICDVIDFVDKASEPLWFYGQVNTGRPWDIKYKDNWNRKIAYNTFPGSYKSPIALFDGITTPEALGNITYGYLGAAAGFPQNILLMGGDAAANGVSISVEGAIKGIIGIIRSADTVEDKENIQRGYNWYLTGRLVW